MSMMTLTLANITNCRTAIQTEYFDWLTLVKNTETIGEFARPLIDDIFVFQNPPTDVVLVALTFLCNCTQLSHSF